MEEAKKTELNKRTFSDVLDCLVDLSVKEFDNNPGPLTHTVFADLISMGELVDRLSIVNIKLFNLKNEVMQRQNEMDWLNAERAVKTALGLPSEDVLVWFKEAAVYDVRLCEERSRIKSCIDKKLLAMIDGGKEHNEEYKSYK